MFPGTCLIVFLSAALMCSQHVPTLLSEPVPNEAGFAGAVRVVDFTFDDGVVYATVNIEYRDVYGKPQMGQGRIFVQLEDLQSGHPVPVFCRVHYEMDLEAAQKWCRRGWAVVTPHYRGPDSEQDGYALELCMGNSYNLSRALIQWVRRLPFADRNHMHLDGESAGAYVALAMSADCFPVASVTASMPVLNWPYSLSYLEKNKALARAPVKDMRESPLPVMGAVSMLTDWSYSIFGNDLRSAKWYFLSPIAYLDRITSPVLLLCATGDMLVPIEQVSRKYVPTLDSAQFPAGFTRNLDVLTSVPNARLTLEEALPNGSIAFHSEPRQEINHEITLAQFMKTEAVPPAPPEKDLWWSRERQWSVVVLDEGPPAPYSAHTRYKWSLSPDSFVTHFRHKEPGAGILTEAKLRHLLGRYMDIPDEAVTLADGTPVSRTNFEVLEKLDVITGLLDYAGLGSPYQARLCRLYAISERKPFGDSLEMQNLKQERRSLLEHLGMFAKL